MFISRMIDEKRRYRRYKARTEMLPPDYRTAIEALERYLTYFGGITQGEIALSMLEDLADLFEQSASSGTSVRDIVGPDPVEFVETFLENYSEGRWINKERARLIDTIDRVAADRSDRVPGDRS